MKKSTIRDCTIIDLPRIEYRAGNISIVEKGNNFPFKVKRVFYIYDIPGGKARGAHAHKLCHQFLVAASGSFTVALYDGLNKKKISLNRPYCGLHIPPGIWANEFNFSSGAICLVLTSHKYNRNDYIRDYEIFKAFKHDS